MLQGKRAVFSTFLDLTMLILIILLNKHVLDDVCIEIGLSHSFELFTNCSIVALDFLHLWSAVYAKGLLCPSSSYCEVLSSDGNQITGIVLVISVEKERSRERGNGFLSSLIWWNLNCPNFTLVMSVREAGIFSEFCKNMGINCLKRWSRLLCLNI